MSLARRQLDEALAALPHGPGFRFIDCVLSLVPGQRGVGQYTLRGDEPFLQSHFPGDPMMPGVLMIEAIAQLGGIVVQSDPASSPLARLKLSAIRNMKIRDAPRPGDTVSIEASVTARFAALIQVEGCMRKDGRILLEGAVVLSAG